MKKKLIKCASELIQIYWILLSSPTPHQRALGGAYLSQKDIHSAHMADIANVFSNIKYKVHYNAIHNQGTLSCGHSLKGNIPEVVLFYIQGWAFLHTELINVC